MKIVASITIDKSIVVLIWVIILLSVFYITQCSFDIQALRLAGEREQANRLIIEVIGIIASQCTVGVYMIHRHDKKVKAQAQERRKNAIEHTEYNYKPYLKTKR